MMKRTDCSAVCMTMVKASVCFQIYLSVLRRNKKSFEEVGKNRIIFKRFFYLCKVYKY